MTYRYLLFIALSAFACFTWWLSGYDFNTRGAEVAIYFVFTSFIVLWLTFIPHDGLDKIIWGGI